MDFTSFFVLGSGPAVAFVGIALVKLNDRNRETVKPLILSSVCERDGQTILSLTALVTEKLERHHYAWVSRRMAEKFVPEILKELEHEQLIRLDMIMRTTDERRKPRYTQIILTKAGREYARKQTQKEAS